MPLILHIGLPKTGTTYLQRTFFNTLANRLDAPLQYPDVGFYNHQIALYEPLGKFLRWNPKSSSTTAWPSLAAYLKDNAHRTSLISAEALSGLSLEGVQELRRLIGEQPVDKIIITARALASLLPSHWQQNMKNGGRGALDRYAERMMDQIAAFEPPSQMFCFRNTIRLWREVFPATPIEVLVMDGDPERNLDCFGALCGLDAVQRAGLRRGIPPASEQNLSFSVEECKVLLALNERIARGEVDPKVRRNTIARFFRKRDQSVGYEKPTLTEALKARADAIDASAFADVVGRAQVHVRRGREWTVADTPAT